MNYFDYFIQFWVPIIKKQVFKAKCINDKKWEIAIKENIWKNWNFTTDQRNFILKEIGL